MTVPVTILTGFLGSGKTTLLNQALRSPAMKRAAVIVNELGSVPLDHLLVREVSPNVMLLESGCICCGLQSDLVDTLVGLESSVGSFPRVGDSFNRVIVETTGVADPAPILATVLRHPALVGQYHADVIVTTFDAQMGATTLGRFAQAEKQLALADEIVITKTDLVVPSCVGELREHVARFNPGARISESGHRAVDLGKLIVWGTRDVQRRLDAGGHVVNTHEANHIRSFSVRSNSHVSFNAFAAWFSMVTQLYGEYVLRVKGLLNIDNEPGPLVVQSVQHVVYPLYSTDAWPTDDRSSRLTVLTCNMDDHLFQSFKDSLAIVFAAA
jgi:G3E family GTPase